MSKSELYREAVMRGDNPRTLLEEREACAQLLEISNSQILLMAEAITESELLLVKAILANRAAAIRERK